MDDQEHTKAYKPEQPSAPDETVDDVGSQAEHPSEDVLLHLAFSRLDEATANTVRTHLNSCTDCTQRLNDLSASLVSLVDELGSTTSPHNEPTAAASSPDETIDHPTPHVDNIPDSTVPTFGDYELIDEIARGGMGVVYKARQKSLNRIVALKMIKSGEFANQEQVDRFYKEAEAAANLDHPGIVPVHEVGEVGGQHYFTMGFVDGDSLADRLRDGPLPPKEAARYAKSIAEAVTYAHSKGVIHRDLKPGNVLITKEGVLRITDFGLAKRIEEDSELTSTGQVLGTPSYMPPEQAEGKLSEIGRPADIYAVGGTLYCMLTGRPPFQAENLIETLHQVLEVEPVSLSTLNRSVPQDLETLCLKCLEKKPSNRYESTDELLTELGRFLNGEPIKARPIGRVERATRWCRRKPIHAIAVAAVLMLAVGGPAFSARLIWSNSQIAKARADALLNASPATIPLILAELDRDASVVRSRLNQLKSDDLTPEERLRLSLALLPSDPSQMVYLVERLNACTYEELAVVLERIKENGGTSLTPDLWTLFHADTTTTNDRFRTGIALAALDPESDQWTDNDYEFLATSMLQENTLHQPAIRKSLSAIAAKLIEPMKKAFVDRDAGESVLESAANAIVDLAGGNSDLLTELSMVATPKQHSILFPPVDQQAETDDNIVKTLIHVTKLQPAEDDNEAQRVRLGKRRAGAAINLVRMGHFDESLEVLRVKDDPESLTQFVHGCKDRGVTVTDLLDLLNRATSITERYGILLALGEFPLTSILEDIRSTWVDHVKHLYANDTSSGIHGVSGWLLRQWGLTAEAKAIDERAVPYSKDREWFTLKINVAGPFEIENYSYFTFVVFSGGEHEIGSPDYELDRDPSDEQRRMVKITRPFAVLDREVTRGEVRSVTGLRGFRDEQPWESDRHAASSAMSWYMAVKFCRGLTAHHGMSETDQCYVSPASLDPNEYPIDPSARNSWDREGPMNWPLDLSKDGFRLPTSAEWEIACRGLTVTRHGFGCDVNHVARYGWHDDSSSNHGHRPRELRPNLGGLFDMHGNMYEWCHDWTEGNTVDVLTDPMGPREGPSRVLRGGGWIDDAILGRSANRLFNQPADTYSYLGFRVVLSIGVSSSHPE